MQRSVPRLGLLILLLCVLSAGTLFCLFWFQSERNLTAQIIDTLPGPNEQLSAKSIEHLNGILVNTPNVLGAYVTKTEYATRENPIIWYDGKSEIFKLGMSRYIATQLSGKGKSSVEVDKSKNQTLRNSTEVKHGKIACGAIQETSFIRIVPELIQAKAVCRAPIPPFAPEANLNIVVVTDIDMAGNTLSSVSIRRALLELQVDIFSRDYTNRDIAIRQSPESINQRKTK